MHSNISNPAYPTQSLRFLDHLNDAISNRHAAEPEQAQVPLQIIIVGAGLGGLAAGVALTRRGHSVTILEQAAELGEVGAGIQIPPNSSRVLLSWGIGEFLKDKVVEPEGMSFRRWEDGRKIAYTKLVPEFRANFEAPYYVVHRAHFHEALHKLAVKLGVVVIVNSKVQHYDAESASVRLTNGKTYSGDLVVAADGIRSAARPIILGTGDKPPMKTGFAAYRATVDVDKINADPELAWLLKKPALNIWIGQDRHVMTYTIAGGKSFNMVLSHVDHSDPATWDQKTAVQDMRNYFSGWDPRLVKIIHMIPTALKWPLMSGAALPKWVADSGKLLMMGDAAHAMVPYMSQGAAMAVEDGAALGEALSLVEAKDQILPALKAFEAVRMKRTSQMQEASLLNGKLWHFADGQEQIARDEATRAEVEGRHFLSSANQWSDPVTQWWAYGYNAEKEMRISWAKAGNINDFTSSGKL